MFIHNMRIIGIAGFWRMSSGVRRTVSGGSKAKEADMDCSRAEVDFSSMMKSENRTVDRDVDWERVPPEDTMIHCLGLGRDVHAQDEDLQERNIGCDVGLKRRWWNTAKNTGRWSGVAWRCTSIR